MWSWFDLAGVDWLILIGRAAYVAIVFIFLLVVSVRVPWQTRSADWLVLGTRTMTVTLTRREGRRTPSLLRYSLELVAQFVNEIMSDSRASRAGALLFASCVLRLAYASCNLLLLFAYCLMSTHCVKTAQVLKCWICMLVDWMFESAVLFESVRRRPISCAVSCQLHSLPPHWTVAARSPQTAPALEHWVRIVFLGRRRLKKHCFWNVKRTPVDSESWLPFIWEHAASIGIFDRVQPVL